MSERYDYHIETPEKNIGVYGNDLDLMVYFADKWTLERGVLHMVMDRDNNLVHYADPSPVQEKPPR